MQYCSLFAPDFIAQALLRSEPAHTGAALAVLEGAAALQRVGAANERARCAGIALGMTKAQAQTIPGVLFRPRAAAQEESAQQALLDCAQSISPRVESTAPGAVTLDLSGLEKLFGPPQTIALLLAERAARSGIEVRIGIAADPETALLAARGLAGITLVEAGRELDHLGHLALDVLLPAPDILEKFDRWGIRTLRALTMLPPVPLVERMGQEGLRLQRLARGESRRTLVLVEPQLHFTESFGFEDAVESLEPLAFVLNRLLENILARLATRSLSTDAMRLRLELEVHTDRQRDAEPAREIIGWHERHLKLPVPTRDGKIWLKLLQLDLAEHSPGAPVKKIFLEAEAARPRVTQSGLFAATAPAPEKLEIMLARVRSVVGVGRVGSPHLRDTHAPDCWEVLPFRPVASDSAPAGDPQPARLALRRFRPPLKAQVEMSIGRVCGLHLRGRRLPAIHVGGPWTSSGSWWEAQSSWAREEWDVAVRPEDGIAVFRIYRDLRSGEWFVEGIYD